MGNKPGYTISTSEEDGILEIVLTGEVTQDSVGKLENEVIDIGKSVNVKNFLIDIREIKGRFRYTGAYYRVRNYPVDRPKINTAIVDLAENADYENFHENTAVNIGLSFKWFTDVDEARDWLKKVSEK